MTLLQLSKNVASLLGKDVKEVQEILEAAFADISATLIDEESVYIKGFGKWDIHHKGGRPHFKFLNYKEPADDSNDKEETVKNNIQILNKYLR